MLAGMLGSIVSGLNYNSQRVSASADNISNVSTAGYKATEVKSTSLVTGQTSINTYSAGGVQAVSFQLINVQGVAEFSTTDMGTEFANLILSHNAYSASLKALSTAEEMSETLIKQLA